MPVKAVLFDMFDTLMLIEKQHMFYNPALRKAHKFLAQNGVDVGFADFRSAYIKARDALYVVADAQLEEPHFNRRVADALLSLGYVFDVNGDVVRGATEAFCGEFMRFVRLDPEAKSALEKLHERFRLGVVSNFAIPECVERLLGEYGLDVFFDVVVVSAAVNKRKPHPEIFIRALERLGVSPEEAVFVGDTVDADVKGAKAAGMKTVFIERRVQEEAAEFCPDQTIKSLGELLRAIERCL